MSAGRTASATPVATGRGPKIGIDEGSDDMTDNQRPDQLGAKRPLAWLALLVTGTLLQACGHNAATGPAGSTLRVYAADLTGGAKTCTVPKIVPVNDKTTEAPMKLANDGGWCGLPVHQDGPKPFASGLLTARPAHGNVLVHEVGDDTRIDYTPDHGFTGADSFSVKLIPGDATIHVAVTVEAPVK
jgi:hypothetical protein